MAVKKTTTKRTRPRLDAKALIKETVPPAKTPPAPKKRGGKPKGEGVKDKLNKKTFEALCALQCTEAEIAFALGVTPMSLNYWCKKNYDGRGFKEVFAEKRCGGMISLRRAQFRMSETNPTMAIFLGKQILGQSDAPQQEHAASAIMESLARLVAKNNGLVIDGTAAPVDAIDMTDGLNGLAGDEGTLVLPEPEREKEKTETEEKEEPDGQTGQTGGSGDERG